MTLWANILEVILEFTMVVILLIIQGNNNLTLGESMKSLLLSFNFTRTSRRSAPLVLVPVPLSE